MIDNPNKPIIPAATNFILVSHIIGIFFLIFVINKPSNKNHIFEPMKTPNPIIKASETVDTLSITPANIPKKLPIVSGFDRFIRRIFRNNLKFFLSNTTHQTVYQSLVHNMLDTLIKFLQGL
jgi:hypothetical protein